MQSVCVCVVFLSLAMYRSKMFWKRKVENNQRKKMKEREERETGGVGNKSGFRSSVEDFN